MKNTNLRRMFLSALLTVGLTGMVATASAVENESKEKAPRAKRGDANKDGVVTPEEKAAATAESERKKAEAAAKQLEKYDANKNGVLDPEEKAAIEADQQAAREKAAAKKAEKAERKATQEAEKEK